MANSKMLSRHLERRHTDQSFFPRVWSSSISNESSSNWLFLPLRSPNQLFRIKSYKRSDYFPWIRHIVRIMLLKIASLFLKIYQGFLSFDEHDKSFHIEHAPSEWQTSQSNQLYSHMLIMFHSNIITPIVGTQTGNGRTCMLDKGVIYTSQVWFCSCLSCIPLLSHLNIQLSLVNWVSANMLDRCDYLIPRISSTVQIPITGGQYHQTIASPWISHGRQPSIEQCDDDTYRLSPTHQSTPYHYSARNYHLSFVIAYTRSDFLFHPEVLTTYNMNLFQLHFPNQLWDSHPLPH